MGFTIGEAILIVFIIGLSVIDLSINSISVIPIFGDLLETLGEAVLEIMQILLVILYAGITRE